MPDVLVRDLDAGTLERLKARARYHGRSLQGELHQIVTDAAEGSLEDRRAVAARIRARLAGRGQTDSGELQAEDRLR